MVGCGHTTYTYKGVKYASQEEALIVQKADLDRTTSQITATEKKRGGSAAIVIPTFEIFCDLGIKKTGNVRQDSVDFIGKTLMASFRSMSERIDKRKIFDKVTLIEDKSPTIVANKIISEYDVVIYFNLVSSTQSQWFVRIAPQYKNRTISFDNSKADGYPRLLSWLESIETNLDESGYMLQVKTVSASKLTSNKKVVATENRPSTMAVIETGRDGRFIAYNNGTVMDTKTNLMWAAQDNGSSVNWIDAKAYCSNYSGGGYTDWRMPTQDELTGLYDEAKDYKSSCGWVLHLTNLIRLTCGFIWASETSGSGAASFDFFSGSRAGDHKPGGYDRALPVRSGK
jgi:hypothetical protein